MLRIKYPLNQVVIGFLPETFIEFGVSLLESGDLEIKSIDAHPHSKEVLDHAQRCVEEAIKKNAEAIRKELDRRSKKLKNCGFVIEEDVGGDGEVSICVNGCKDCKKDEM